MESYCSTCGEWWEDVQVMHCPCGRSSCGNCVILDEDTEAADESGLAWKCPGCKKVWR